MKLYHSLVVSPHFVSLSAYYCKIVSIQFMFSQGVYDIYTEWNFFFGTMISEGKCADSSSTVPGVADQDLRITEKSIRPHKTTRGFGKSGKHASSNI